MKFDNPQNKKLLEIKLLEFLYLVHEKQDFIQTLQASEEGKNVTESAFEVGYLNISNFIKAYKSVYGETPKVMQKSLI